MNEDESILKIVYAIREERFSNNIRVYWRSFAVKKIVLALKGLKNEAGHHCPLWRNQFERS